jgi:hypothetical protein
MRYRGGREAESGEWLIAARVGKRSQADPMRSLAIQMHARECLVQDA